MSNPNCQPTLPPNSKKRPRSLLEDLVELDEFVPKAIEPRFLIVQLKDGKTFKTVSPFAQKRGLLHIAGEVKHSKCLRDGSLLVEVASCAQSKKLQSATMFDTMPINVTAHKSLNSSKGVVFCHDLLEIDVKEIVQELSSQHVVDVVRVSSRKSGTEKPTPLLILTFGTPKLPEFVFAGYLRLVVRPHIPNPLRCFTCQIFGHSSVDCKRKPVCGKCAEEGHLTASCNNSFCCASCGAAHPVWSRDCPQWQMERKIMEIKTVENISLFDARKRVKSQNNFASKSFANAVGSGAAVSAETTRLQAMLEKQLQLSAEQAKRHEEMEERHRQEIEEMKKQLEDKNKQIDSLKEQIAQLIEVRTLQLDPVKGRPKETGPVKKKPIIFDPNTSSTSTSLTLRKEGNDMDIDPNDETADDWQPVKERDRGKEKNKGKT
jgi:hypothetical protein